VIVADTTQATEAARAAASTIPIVMAIVADPVGSGVVANLSQPGGNITGLSIMPAELSAKQLQLESLKAAALSLPVELTPVSARTAEEIGPAFEAASRARAEALYVVDCPPFFTHRSAIVKRAMSARLPVISGEKPYADERALLRRTTEYVDKIFKGARPGGLPIEQPKKVDLVINLKTAHALGLTIPPSLLQRADQVIE
jgi:putative tryptophan/tyrosine transport system substrate-binding protein